MSVLEVISLGCALVSVSTDVAPFINKWTSKKESRRKDVKKSLGWEPRQLQEKYGSDDTRLGPRYTREQEISSSELKDLIKQQSQLVSTLHLMLGSDPEKNDKPCCMSEDSRTYSVPALVDQAQHLSLEPGLRTPSFSASNQAQHRALENPTSRVTPLSMPNLSYNIHLETPPRRSFSLPFSTQYRPESREFPPRVSPLPMPNSSPSLFTKTPLPRAVSFPLSNDNRRGSIPPPRRASSFSVPDQRRKSLKIPSRASSIPSLMPREIEACPFLRPSTSTKISRLGSFYELLDPNQLPQLLPYLNNISTQRLVHHALEWSYPQTLDQFLHPDRFYLKGDAVMHRSYLSSTVRSHIYILAYTFSSSSDFGPLTQGFVLAIFLIRFVMNYGVDVLRDAPFQYEDTTGLREMNSNYEMVKEISIFFKGE